MTDRVDSKLAGNKNREAELPDHLQRPDMNKERFEELAVARVVVGDIGRPRLHVVPITNNGRLCPFMVGRLPASLPVPTFEIETAGLRRSGKKYVFIAVCGANGVITDDALHASLSGA